MNYLYGFVIDSMIYLEFVEVASRSPHWKREFDELCEAYEPEASFVIKEGSGIVVQEGMDELPEDVDALWVDLAGLVSIEGLSGDTYEILIGSGDYFELADLILEDEEEEEDQEA